MPRRTVKEDNDRWARSSQYIRDYAMRDLALMLVDLEDENERLREQLAAARPKGAT